MVGKVRSVAESFDSTGCSFAAVCGDGRVKVWDTASGKLKIEYISEDHLTNKFTCIAWPQAQATIKRKKGKKAKTSGASNSCIALGTENGSIVVYNLIRGCVEMEFKSSHTKKINNLVWSKDNTSLFSCSEDKLIVHWSIENQVEVKRWKADSQPTTALCLNKAGSLLVTGGRVMKTWDLETYKVIHKYTGHSRPIQKIDLTFDEKFIVSMAEGDSYLGVWELEEPENSFSLSMDGDIAFMDVAKTSDPEYRILAGSQDGEVNVWISAFDDAGKNKIEHGGSLKFVSEDGSAANVLLDCEFDYASPEKKIKISRGNILKPVYESVLYVSEDGEFVKNHTVTRCGEKGMLLNDNESTKASKKRQTVNISGPGEQSLAAPMVDGEDVEMDVNEASMGEKLADMTVQEMAEAPQSSGRTPPKAESLVKMLVQALHSDDNSLLEECLNTTNETVVRNTVKRLPTQYVVPFLTKTIHKFQAKPSRGVMLVPWIKTIILIHTSYLMSIPDLSKSLGGLYQLVDTRLSSFKKLLKLSGRLELIMTQITTKGDGSNSVALDDIQEASMVYEEEDSDEEDMMDDLDVEEDLEEESEEEAMSEDEDKEDVNQ